MHRTISNNGRFVLYFHVFGGVFSTHTNCDYDESVDDFLRYPQQLFTPITPEMPPNFFSTDHKLELT